MSSESHHCEGGYLQEKTNLPLHLLSDKTAKNNTDSLKPTMIPGHLFALFRMEMCRVQHFKLSSCYIYRRAEILIGVFT